MEGKRALQLLEEHFAAGLAAPAYVIVDPADGNVDSVQGSVTRLIDGLKRDAAFVEPFRVNVNQAGDLLLVQAPMVAGSNDNEAEEAVRRLRQDIVPDAFEDGNTAVYVSGATAGSIDFVDNMNGRIPYVFGFVLGLAFLLLMVMFRSIVIPVKAIALNLLSVGAAYGVLVLVFQQGWGIGLLGIETTGLVTAWLPVFLFAMLFGLSMDYHMLLLGRIKELHDQGLSNDAAVSEGVKVTAGQITSAAAVMVGVFAAFALSRGVEIKQFGVGMGVAVLIDATIIRSVLLPASMTLLGDRNWYLPSWLEWLPRIGVGEGGDTEPQPAAQPAYGAASAGGDA